jgi:Trypsin-like peptidase domain/Effector-associated domain 1
MKPLSDGEVVEVASALLKGFIKKWQWKQLAATAADINLDLDIEDGALRAVANDVVAFAEAKGATEMLLRQAALERPENPMIVALVARYGLAPAPLANVRVISDRGGPIALPESDRSTYEAIVLENAGMVKPGQWRAQMTARESAVCQILYLNDAIGTGFLVGPDLVMSNWHVFEDQTKGQLRALGDFATRFDYRAAAGAAPASNGKTVAIKADAGYLASSPKTDLDYVLFQLGSRAADEVVDHNATRDYLRPASREFDMYEAALVLQHPKGRSLELAIGPTIGWIDDAHKGEIYAHYANTDEGSSGSPCFTCKWELAAIHHRSDPHGRGANRAIAMTAVLQDMGNNGTLALLPELA